MILFRPDPQVAPYDKFYAALNASGSFFIKPEGQKKTVDTTAFQSGQARLDCAFVRERDARFSAGLACNDPLGPRIKVERELHSLYWNKK